jgi:hypothetical protein
VQIWDTVALEMTGGQPVTEFWQWASVVKQPQLRRLWHIIWYDLFLAGHVLIQGSRELVKQGDLSF